MFGIKEWRQTKFYQEVEQETKLEIALRLLKMGLGLSVEQIAQALELEVEVVRKAIEKQSRRES
jgi:predicted transposase YdaD